MRRSNGEGSWYFDGKRWCCKKWVSENGLKKRISLYAKTKIELMQKYIQRFGDNVNEVDKLDFHFNDYVLNWLLNYKKLIVSSRTINSQLTIYKNHVKPYFVNIKLNQISNEFIINYFNWLNGKEVSNNIFMKCKFLLNQVFNHLRCSYNNFNYPFILKSIKSNQTGDVIVYKAIPKEIRNLFVKKLNSNILLKNICYLGLYAGLRIGEILALTWDNVDMDNRIIRIRASTSICLSFDKIGDVTSKKNVINSTKTDCSIRNVPICDVLYNSLMDWKLYKRIKNNNPIYVFDSNNEIRNYSSTNKMLRRFCKAQGFDKYNIHFHSLRHTFATMLLEENINPKIVQFLLGHKSVKTTLQIYNNVDYNLNYFSEILNKVVNKY